MEFKRITGKNYRLEGSSLWFELPEATNEKMRKLFGTGLSAQDRCKYSTSIGVHYAGFQYDFYKSYGVWRVGAGHDASRDPEIEQKIRALFK